MSRCVTPTAKAKSYYAKRPLNKIVATIELFQNYIPFRIVYLFYALCFLVGVYIFYGNYASLMCNLAAIIYPVYGSLLAMQSVDPCEDTLWLTYWILFALFSLVECLAESIISSFSVYWLGKYLVCLWLCLPLTAGAQWVYATVFVPLMQWLDIEIFYIDPKKMKTAVDALKASGYAERNRNISFTMKTEFAFQ